MSSCPKCIRYLFIILLALGIFSRPAMAGIKAMVSIMPQKFFLEQLAGNLVEVVVMVPPGASPHTYEPRPSQMLALQTADVYFTIGIEFEKAWLCHAP
jgi:zinc transport system substrate-binding protein